ncbi:replicative DNA helicase [Mycoplasmopsis lipofaciens]|uniref:replicative DNA helicase n=1 Tax=Mycoplasmopsis lipofaciens TaxID=114884 RepID=UPI00048A343F|nr:replicative DNA helicase [Mycoplasmopsis lipofaciens]
MTNKSESEYNENISKHTNVEYESALLSLILRSNELSGKIIPFLMEEDFSVFEYRELFKIFRVLFENNQSINDDRILDLAKRNKKNIIDATLLSYLYTVNSYSANIQIYLEELIRLTSLRKIERKIKEVSNKMNVNPKISESELINEIQQLILDIDRSQVSSDFLTAKDVSDKYLSDLEARKDANINEFSGIPTGFKEIDNTTQGLHGGELIILAARPGIGKTAFALNIATNIAQHKGKRVAFFSWEMTPIQLMGRIYSSLTEIEANKFKKPQMLTDNEFIKINAVKMKKIDKLNLYMDDSYNTDLNNLIWKCRRLHKVNPLSLIIIDYLQLVESSGNKFRSENDRQKEVSKISRALKTLSLELNIPILALSQLSREVEKREDKRPMLSDLRESGAIEQDADIVMFIYRESYYNNKKKNSEEKQNHYIQEGYADIGTPTNIIIAKHRNGSTGSYNLRFFMTYGKFTDIDYSSYKDFSENEYE